MFLSTRWIGRLTWHAARRAVNSKQHCRIVSCSKQLCCWTLILLLYRVHAMRIPFWFYVPYYSTVFIWIRMMMIKHGENATYNTRQRRGKNEEYLGTSVGVHNSSAVKSRFPDEFQPLVRKCKVTGRKRRVFPCRSAYFASPWRLLTLNLRRRRREAALLFPESWWHLTMWALARLVSWQSRIQNAS